ncbi:protein ALP1-like [Maniola jurtina]|uniref:protein ALP1-like n=2 Tax=Maniola jurtina TaxID=191418 RepID=UPI001E68C195|nr:protein ALP1-like [Maniola jurtina]
MDRKRRLALLLLLRNRRNRRKITRRYWISPFISLRNRDGQFFFLEYRELLLDEKKFYNFFRMSVSSFECLLKSLEPHIRKNYTNMRNPVEPVEMLGITLRYLGSGNSITDLHFKFKRGKSTIAYIIQRVCRAIWTNLLRDNIPELTTESFQTIARGFDVKANFPQCVGAIDGKHIRVCNPANSGSLFFNYKAFFSIVLLAIVDSNYKFVFVDIGAYGKECDSTILQNSKLYELMINNNLPLPQPQPLSGSNIPTPYVFVGDEAFGLSKHIMRPYGGQNLDLQQKVFNYRLSRARRYVECAFGIMANKWRIFHRPIDVSYDFATDIIKACCVLHNFVADRDGFRQRDKFAISVDEFLPIQPVHEEQTAPNVIRQQYATYFMTRGTLPWQLNKV